MVDALSRNNLLQDYRLSSLCEDVLKLAEENNIFDASMDIKEKKKEIWQWILQDFCGVWDRRNSLEGVGLVSFIPVIPKVGSRLKSYRDPPGILARRRQYAYIRHYLIPCVIIWLLLSPMMAQILATNALPQKTKEYKFRGESSDIKKGIYSFVPAPGRLNTRLEYPEKDIQANYRKQ